jgi:hypothetical protein
MKQLIFILITLVISLTISAQMNQEVVSSAGGNKTNSGISLNWTLGEPIVRTFIKRNLSPGQRFQQRNIVTSIEENIDVLVKVKVYPNPANEYINIQFEKPVEKDIVVTILDSQGKYAKSDVIESSISEKLIDLQYLPAGIYYLKLIRGKFVNVYKVVKL